MLLFLLSARANFNSLHGLWVSMPACLCNKMYLHNRKTLEDLDNLPWQLTAAPGGFCASLARKQFKKTLSKWLHWETFDIVLIEYRFQWVILKFSTYYMYGLCWRETCSAKPLLYSHLYGTPKECSLSKIFKRALFTASLRLDIVTFERGIVGLSYPPRPVLYITTVAQEQFLVYM